MTETHRTDRSAPRRGRPPGTSRAELEAIALRLFAEHGFDGTTVEMIAAEAGTSRRTFFRYFDTKTGVLWRAFDVEVAGLRAALDAMPADVPVMEAVRRAVLAVNHYREDGEATEAHDYEGLRTRMHLIGSTPELAASATVHYDAWERAVAGFAARRSGLPTDSLLPLAVGRATLAVCRAAFDRWVAAGTSALDLTDYLDAALRALAAGFADGQLVAEPPPRA